VGFPGDREKSGILQGAFFLALAATGSIKGATSPVRVGGQRIDQAVSAHALTPECSRRCSQNSSRCGLPVRDNASPGLAFLAPAAAGLARRRCCRACMVNGGIAARIPSPALLHRKFCPPRKNQCIRSSFRTWLKRKLGRRFMKLKHTYLSTAAVLRRKICGTECPWRGSLPPSAPILSN
jgi:hypothetical protein